MMASAINIPRCSFHPIHTHTTQQRHLLHNSPFINMNGLYEMSLTSWKLKWTYFMLTHLSIKIRKNWIQSLLNGAVNNNESWDLFSLNYYILSNLLCTKNMAYLIWTISPTSLHRTVQYTHPGKTNDLL